MGRFRQWVDGLGQQQVERVDIGVPIEGTSMSLFQSIIPNWYNEQLSQSLWGDASLADRVWVANRCQQLNSQQIASMPLVFHGSTVEPAWLSSPDPSLFPNGVGDVIHAIVNQVYGYGWSLQYVIDTYADGFPRRWTVIPSWACEPRFEDGSRVYPMPDGTFLDPSRVIQIDRNPTTAAHGTSALRAYAQIAYGLLGAGNQSSAVTGGAAPQAVVKSQRKMTKEQADALKAEWATASESRNGLPIFLPPELDYSVLSFSPADLSLLETQEWNARVIATAYGVPAVILNMSLQGGLTYQNPAALGEMWWRFELRTTATRIANAFSAQMLPRGQWVSFDAADTFAEITDMSDDDDEQLSQVAKASPTQQQTPKLAAIGGST